LHVRNEGYDARHSINPTLLNRRDLINQSVLVSTAFLGLNAFADDSISARTVPKSKSVIILGANGGTGRECVSAVLASGRTCYATTRSGSFNYDEESSSSLLSKDNPRLFQDQADVSSLAGLLALVDKINSNTSESVGAMIFAASASAKGNDALDVDYQGVINAAKVCIEKNIPRLVVVSSGAVTRPNSAVYKLLNFVGNGIMKAKIDGENEVRALYENKKDQGLGYTIVRPGGLTNEAAMGPSFLEMNQGDDKSGRLSRADVAGICIGCLDVAGTFDTTFECYLKDTAKPVDNVGLSNILRSTDPTSYRSGRERNGETWDELLGGLKTDFA
jgi:dTDP-4-dehydrorhamnose reductase